jgi:mannitol operon transcriptional antiterminator
VDLERDRSNLLLINRLLEHISQAYSQHSVREDRTLRDGLTNHIIPACMRQKFKLWLPSDLNPAGLDDRFEYENKIAHQLADIVFELMDVQLPENEINNLALLLRAAYIRVRPSRLHQVIIVCPSGMATAQLLLARLEARFPRLGSLNVISLRQLNPEAAAAADLILSTVPLPRNISERVKVIQVHPLLMPEDVEAITRFLS